MSDHGPRPEYDADELLGGVPAEIEPPAGLRHQVVGALRAQGLVRETPTSWPPVPYWLLTVAATVMAFLGGRASANGVLPQSGDAPEIAVATGAPGLTIPVGSSAWVFLLYEDERFDAADRSPAEIARSYEAWARRSAERGIMLLAEKFADTETLLVQGEATTRPLGLAVPPGMLGGMFVVAAPTREAALALARETPHHDLGGIVLMREIDRASR